jgi:hypothetical protein
MGMFPGGSVRAQAASGLSLRIRRIIESGTLARLGSLILRTSILDPRRQVT